MTLAFVWKGNCMWKVLFTKGTIYDFYIWRIVYHGDFRNLCIFQDINKSDKPAVLNPPIIGGSVKQYALQSEKVVAMDQTEEKSCHL